MASASVPKRASPMPTLPSAFLPCRVRRMHGVDVGALKGRPGADALGRRRPPMFCPAPRGEPKKKSTISVFRRFRPPGAVSGPRGLQKRTQDEKPRPMDPGRGPGTNSERISVREKGANGGRRMRDKAECKAHEHKCRGLTMRRNTASRLRARLRQKLRYLARAAARPHNTSKSSTTSHGNSVTSCRAEGRLQPLPKESQRVRFSNGGFQCKP